MDINGVLCTAASLAYFTLGRQLPLSTSHPLVIVTALGCYAVPMLYANIASMVPPQVGAAMSGQAGIIGQPLLAVGVSYGVARFMNI